MTDEQAERFGGLEVKMDISVSKYYESTNDDEFEDVLKELMREPAPVHARDILNIPQQTDVSKQTDIAKQTYRRVTPIKQSPKNSEKKRTPKSTEKTRR